MKVNVYVQRAGTRKYRVTAICACIMHNLLSPFLSLFFEDIFNILN